MSAQAAANLRAEAEQQASLSRTLDQAAAHFLAAGVPFSSMERVLRQADAFMDKAFELDARAAEAESPT